MPEVDQPEGNANERQQQNHNSFRAAYSMFKRMPVGLRRIVIGSACVALGVIAIAVFHPSMDDRWKFGTDMLLNVLILMAITIQAYIYTQQWEAMNEGLQIERAKTNPRLRVARVRAEGFQIGKRPVFIVTITNDGLIAATSVRVHMEVLIGTDKEIGWIHAPVVSIPANGQEHYFIRSSSWLTQEQFVAFNNDLVLKVMGYFEYWPIGRTNFCYKYVPWDEERPKDVPQFVPCDFEPRLNTTLHLAGIEAKLTLHAAGVVIAKATKETEPQERPANDNSTQQD